jgi:hypothetical protein
MENFYPTMPGRPNEEEKEHNHRLLRKLRIALLFWLVSLIITIIWFSYSPAV